MVEEAREGWLWWWLISARNNMKMIVPFGDDYDDDDTKFNLHIVIKMWGSMGGWRRGEERRVSQFKTI